MAYKWVPVPILNVASDVILILCVLSVLRLYDTWSLWQYWLWSFNSGCTKLRPWPTDEFQCPFKCRLRSCSNSVWRSRIFYPVFFTKLQWVPENSIVGHENCDNKNIADRADICWQTVKKERNSIQEIRFKFVYKFYCTKYLNTYYVLHQFKIDKKKEHINYNGSLSNNRFHVNTLWHF
jgi:hypothetical protein